MLRRPRGALRAAELIHLAGSCASTQALTCRIPDVDDELGNPVGVGKRALPTEAFLRHRSEPESGALAECVVQLVDSVLPLRPRRALNDCLPIQTRPFDPTVQPQPVTRSLSSVPLFH